jgi:rhodanese-related sulfurtransferase
MNYEEMVNDAKSRVRVVGKDELERELADGEALVIDIREVQERWNEGAIPGAKHVSRGMLEFWADPTSPYHKGYMDPSRRTILHCAGGLRSALAADTLMKMGYRDVAHLEIGFSGWREAGGAVEDVPVPEKYREKA